MRRFLFTFLLLLPALAMANAQDVRKALIERDQRSAEFARPHDRAALEALHARQRRAGPDDRELARRERDAVLLENRENRGQSPVSNGSPLPLAPLPLPGRAAGTVNPIPVQGSGG